MRKSVLALVAVALAFAALGVYWHAFDNDFVWDDPIIFERQLPYFDSFKNVFFPPPQIPEFGEHYYRPLTIVTFQIDEALAAMRPIEERDEARRATFHASVVVYHALATVLLFFLGMRFMRLLDADSWLALAGAGGAALLFAAHPIHVESVAWMAGRTDVLCAIFVFAALLMYLRYRETAARRDFAVCAGLFFLGLLAKETAASLLLLIPVVDLLLGPIVPGARGESAEKAGGKLSRQQRRRASAKGKRAPAPARGTLATWQRWGLLAAVFAAYFFLLRQPALTSSGLVAQDADPFAFFGAIGFYLGKSVWAGAQSAFVHRVPGGVVTAFGVAALLAAAGLGFWSWSKKRLQAETIALALAFATMAPSLAIALYKISETPLAERYAYMPSAGLYLLAALLLVRLASRLGKLPVAGAAALVLVPFVGLSAAATWVNAERGKVWQENGVFWEDMAEKAYDAGIPHLHLGMHHASLGKLDEAIAEYELALRYYTDREGKSIAYNNLGSAYLQRGDLKLARETLLKSLEQRPNYHTPRFNLASVELFMLRGEKDPAVRRARIELALRYLDEAIRINPRYIKALLRYGETMLTHMRELPPPERNPRLALERLERVVQLAPASGQAQRARAILARAGAGRR